MIAYMREYLVSHYKWLGDEEFVDALEISETLPGVNTVNMAVIVGDDLRGVPGAALAVAGVLLPGVIFVMSFGILWQEHRHNPHLASFLLGVAATAVSLLLVVTLQVGSTKLTRMPDALIIFLTFATTSVFHFPLPATLLGIGGLSVWLYRPKPHRLTRHPGEHLPLPRGPRHGKLRH